MTSTSMWDELPTKFRSDIVYAFDRAIESFCEKVDDAAERSGLREEVVQRAVLYYAGADLADAYEDWCNSA